MTVSVDRDSQNPNNIKVQINYGPVQASVSEDYGHLRSVWNHLGRLLEEIEHEAKVGQ